MTFLNWISAGTNAAVCRTPNGIVRSLFHNGTHYICNWAEPGHVEESWFLDDETQDLESAKRVVEMWESN